MKSGISVISAKTKKQQRAKATKKNEASAAAKEENNREINMIISIENKAWRGEEEIVKRNIEIISEIISASAKKISA